MVIYSQTDAFAQDEGFHLLAAQSIFRGRRPYLDFMFPQTPLNAYWNAFLFRLFGDTWRTAHAGAAAMTSAAIFLIGDFVFRRFPVREWKLAAAISAVAIFGCNIAVVQFGSLQAYGVCLFLSVAAFRLTLGSVCRRGVWFAAGAGFCAGAAAGSSLLTAPVGPVLFVWMMIYNRDGNRWRKAAAFLAAAIAAVLPILRLFIENPRIVLFDIVQYMMIYRRVQWPSATRHDFGEWTAWLASPQAILTGLLAIGGLLFVRFRSDWAKGVRSELYLCAWLGGAVSLHVSAAHPTFVRYYLLALPFLAVLASAGLYHAADRLYRADRRLAPVLVVTVLLAGALAKALVESHSDDMKWSDYEAIAAKVDQVTPKGGAILGDEQIYFLTRRPPVEGAEAGDSHGLEFSPEMERQLHIFTLKELKRRAQAGEFNTVQTCGSDDYQHDTEGLPGPYKNKEEISGCAIYWK
jgi:hypothetical protein